MELIDVIGPILLKCPSAPPMLSALEVGIVKEFIELLGPFEEATKIVCGEYYITASKTIPVINTLKNKLEIYLPITDTAKHLKKCLIEHVWDSVVPISATPNSPQHLLDRGATSPIHNR